MYFRIHIRSCRRLKREGCTIGVQPEAKKQSGTFGRSRLTSWNPPGKSLLLRYVYPPLCFVLVQRLIFEIGFSKYILMSLWGRIEYRNQKMQDQRGFLDTSLGRGLSLVSPFLLHSIVSHFRFFHHLLPRLILNHFEKMYIQQSFIYLSVLII